MRRGKHLQIQSFIFNLLIRESVPVVVAFTKSDASYPQISGSESGNSQFWACTRSKAYVQCEQLCRPLFRMEPRDVPAELLSGDYSFLRLGLAL